MEDPVQEFHDVWICREIIFLTKFSQEKLTGSAQVQKKE